MQKYSPVRQVPHPPASSKPHPKTRSTVILRLRIPSIPLQAAADVAATFFTFLPVRTLREV